MANYIRVLRDVRAVRDGIPDSHGACTQVDLANKADVRGADFILGADTHERVRTPIAGKYSRVTEPGAFGSFVARLDVILEDGKVKDSRYALLDADPEKYPADKGMLDLVAEISAPYQGRLRTVVGSTNTTLVRYYVIENPLDNLITDAIMWRLQPDIAPSNGFRFCPLIGERKKPRRRSRTTTSEHPRRQRRQYGEATGAGLDWLNGIGQRSQDPANRFGGWSFVSRA